MVKHCTAARFGLILQRGYNHGILYQPEVRTWISDSAKSS